MTGTIELFTVSRIDNGWILEEAGPQGQTLYFQTMRELQDWMWAELEEAVDEPHIHEAQ